MNSIEDIIVAHLNDEATTDEVERLLAWIREKPENANEFARYAVLHAHLRSHFVGQRAARESAETPPVATTHAVDVPHVRRTGRRSLGLALAVALLFTVGAGVWWMSAGDDTADDLIVLSAAEHGSKPTLPFTFEAEADVIAIAVMGQRQTRHGQRIIGLDLVDVLKGEQQISPLESADGMAPFGCILPANPRTFADMYREGERVAVYLKRAGDGWITLQMSHLTGQYEPQWRAGVESFLNVLLASAADDPQQRYAELLTAPGSQPRITEPAYYALLFNPDPRAAPPLRELLVAAIGPGLQRDSQPKALRSDQQPALQQPAKAQRTQMPKSASEAATFSNTPLDLVFVLARIHDAQSVLPVISHIRQLDPASRDPFISYLPELCQQADAATLRLVRMELTQYIEKFPGDQQHVHYRNLVRTRAAIDTLLEDKMKDGALPK